MVLKDHSKDKHSSRRKVLGKAAAKVLASRQRENLPSNDFRFHHMTGRVEDSASSTAIEVKLAQIAEQDHIEGCSGVFLTGSVDVGLCRQTLQLIGVPDDLHSLIESDVS